MKNWLKTLKKTHLVILLFGSMTCTAAIAEENVMILPDGSAEVVTSAGLGLSSKSTQSTSHSTPTLSARIVDSGGFINSIGTGVGGADESILQNNSLFLNVLGFGVSLANNQRLADDFTLTATETINTITFYAYQTGSTTTSTLSAVNLRIWDGLPTAPGSNIVFGDATTDRLASTTWSNVYRVTEPDTGIATNRPIMEAVVTVGASLPPGTYWLDWQIAGTLGSGPWAPPITITGQTITGDALQSTDSGATYNALTDSGTGTAQGLPFRLDIVDRDPTSIPIFSPLGLIVTLAGLVWFGRRRKLKQR